jgi:aminopeptidase Y
MPRLSITLPVALSILRGASAFQIPFLWVPDEDKPIISAPSTPVTSDALQELIDPDKLLRRAEQLFEIAKLGVDEYGHPTRVIGSRGTSYSFISRLSCHLQLVVQ